MTSCSLALLSRPVSLSLTKSHLVSLGPGNLSRGRAWPFPGALTLVLLVALLCFSSAPSPVIAADFTIDKERTTPQVVNGLRDTLTITKDGSIILRNNEGDNTPALTIANIVTVTIVGQVSSEGELTVKLTNANKGAGTTLTLSAGGSIKNHGEFGAAVDSERDDVTFNMEGGTISVHNTYSAAVSSSGEKFQFTMRGGSITATGADSDAVFSTGEKFQFEMQGGSITTNGASSRAIYLYPEGNLDAKSGQGFEHLVDIGKNASVTAKGVEARAILINNNPGTSRTRIDIKGTVTAEGKDAVAVLIRDKEVTEFMISGTVKADKDKQAKIAIKTENDAPLKLDIQPGGQVIGAIVLTGAVDSITLAATASIEGNIDFGGGNDIFTLNGGTVTGDIDMGEGVDTLTLNGGAIINGDIDMGGGNDTLTINGAAGRINGRSSSKGDKKTVVIKMGEGDDTFKLKSLDNLPYGMIDGEGGNDTIDLTGLLKALTEGRKTSLLFAWKSFERELGIVKDEEEEEVEVEKENPNPPPPPPPPPDEKEAEEKAVAPDEKEAEEKEAEEKAVAPDEKEAEEKEAEEKAVAPDEKEAEEKEAEENAGAPDEKEGGEEEVENAGGASGNGNGGGQALASGPSGQLLDQRELDKYGPYLIGINLPGQAGYDPNKEKIVYAFNPSGQAVEAQALTGLTDALHDLGARRLGRGGSSARRAARPLQVAASERIPGLLFRDRRPSVWGEAFGLYQRRGRDGFASGYAMNQKGVALGVEQGFRGERARLGLLVGYARAALRTRPWDIRTDSDSFFAGVYGRQRLDGLYESLYVQGSLNVSLSKHDNRRRTMNHDARGKYSSWGVSPSLTVGRVFRLETVLPGGELSLEPSVDLRYSAGFYDDYRETGEPGLVMTIKERVQQSLSGRLNLAGIYDLPDEGGSVSLRLGLSHRRLFASDLEGSFSDRAFKFKSAASNNVTLGHVGVDIAVNLTEGLSLNGRYEYSHSIGTVSDRTNSGQLSLVYRF